MRSAYHKETYEDTSRVIRSRKSKMDRQHNCQEENKTNGQTIIYKTLHKKKISNSTNPTNNLVLSNFIY